MAETNRKSQHYKRSMDEKGAVQLVAAPRQFGMVPCRMGRSGKHSQAADAPFIDKGKGCRLLPRPRLPRIASFRPKGTLPGVCYSKFSVAVLQQKQHLSCVTAASSESANVKACFVRRDTGCFA
jgi:hypothetical protein